MAATRVTRPKATSTVTRRTRAVAQSSGDALAKELDRVLKVSDPVPQPGQSTTRKTAASSSRTAPAPTARKTITAASRTIKTASPTKKTARSAPVKANDDLASRLPWTSEQMSSLKRAKGAMAAINSGIKSLSTAVQSGYRYSPTDAPRKVEGKGKQKEKETEGEWTERKVQEVVETCEIALRILRELDVSGDLGTRGIEVERASLGIVAKCLTMGMYRQALSQLVVARPALLRRYTHVSLPPTAALSATTTKKASAVPSKTPALTPSTYKHTMYPAKPSSTMTQSPPEAVDPAWVDLTWMPAPVEGSCIDETFRGMLCQAMLSAWVGLAGLAGAMTDMIALLPAVPEASSSRERLHPLEVSLSLPINTSTSSLHLLYRILTALSPKDRTQWLHTRHIALLALSTTLTTQSPPSKTTPGQFWEHTRTTLAKVAEASKGSDDLLTKVSDVVLDIVSWVNRLIEARVESRDEWYKGKEWNAFMDFWIDVARRVGHSPALDCALAMMTASSSISISPPSTNGSASPSSPTRPSIKGKEKSSSNVAAELTRLNGDLAKTNLVLDKYLAEPTEITIAAAESALRSSSLDDLTDVLTSLEDGSTVKDGLAKLVRSVERIRRDCVKIMNTPNADADLTLSVQRWLVSAVDFAQDILQSPLDISDVAQNMVTGAIDTLLTLCKTPTSGTMADLDRGLLLCDLSRQSTKESDRADWLRCLSACAYNVAAGYWKEGKYKECLGFATRSTDWAKLVLPLIIEEDRSQSVWKGFCDQIRKKFELVAGCYHKLSDRQATCDAYFSALAYSPESTLNALMSDLSSKSLDIAFAPLIDLNATVTRLVQSLAFDPSGIAGRTKHCTEVLDVLQPAAKGAILERIIGGLAEGLTSPDLAEVVLELCNVVVDIYTEENMPIRKLRVIVKTMSIIAQCGSGKDRFEDLASQVGQLASAPDPRLDVGLIAIKDELVVSALFIRSLLAYHIPEPNVSVYELAKQAMSRLRSLLIPPRSDQATATPKLKPAVTQARTAASSTRTARTSARAPARAVPDPRTESGPGRTAVKVPVTKAKPRVSDVTIVPVFVDVAQLGRLLGSLSALLGMLGHVLAKVESLKLHRALLRHDQDLVDDYVSSSSILAIEYLKLGKQSRAKSVFSQSARYVENSKKEVTLHVRVELQLRHAIFLAMTGHLESAEAEYATAFDLNQQILPVKQASHLAKVIERRELLARATLARNAMAAIFIAKGDAASAISHLNDSFRLASRIAEVVCRISPQQQSVLESTTASKPESDDPFSAPKRPVGADEPSKDSTTSVQKTSNQFAGRHLYGYQWSAAEDLINQILVLTAVQANRGTVSDAEYFLKQAKDIAQTVESPIMISRINTRLAELSGRRRKYEDSIEKLAEAANGIPQEGLEAVDISRVKGDIFTKQDMIEEAGEMFDTASKEVQGLDAVFVAAEALMPSPKKGMRASVASALASVDGAEMLLPEALAHVLRQQAWLLREAGYPEDCDQILAQIRQLTSSSNKAEELYLDGRIGLHDAFSHFKTDLWMSSVTESTIAMPMGDPGQRTRDRQSTRQSIQRVLQRSEQSFLEALSLASSTGRVEDVRQACLSLALLRAFQTSLGEGSADITRLAAAILASSPAITLHREMIETIDLKFQDPDRDITQWPVSSSQYENEIASARKIDTHSPTPNGHGKMLSSKTSSEESDGLRLQEYWQSVQAKYSANALPTEFDTSSLPPDWTVVSINVTEDKNTMFISRHRSDSEPLVFTLPLDRQGRREGEAEEDLFTFEVALQQLQDIIDESNGGARNAKNVVSAEDRRAWWSKRFDLDKRLQELVQSMEFCWLGAFKTILSPKCDLPASALQVFRNKLEKIFNAAISSGAELRKPSKVHLDNALLECFAALKPDCKDEEAEDLVYFILDIYQFYGVPVALAELDIDQIAIDVKTALTELDASRSRTATSGEHLFLALDKNISCFPWESIPTLRGRAVSRIPSLSFLLDQIQLSNHLSLPLTPDGKRLIDVKKVFYILNPSGDLARTQTFFEPWLERMKTAGGWKGIVGRSPTELEMVDALSNHQLVLYFGHGGAEQYIRSYKVKALSRCATVMLWGCSSGHLKDQGDFDRTGTAWNYMMAGSPSLVANLWDVTDRDIDILSQEVFKQLNIDSAHIASSSGQSQTQMKGSKGFKGLLPISELSNVQAVAKAREECKLKYLTGAAPVVYGLPVYMH